MAPGLFRSGRLVNPDYWFVVVVDEVEDGQIAVTDEGQPCEHQVESGGTVVVVVVGGCGGDGSHAASSAGTMIARPAAVRRVKDLIFVLLVLARPAGGPQLARPGPLRVYLWV